MKSPFTGNEAEIVISNEVFEYRKEQFSYYNIQFRCPDTDEYFAPLEVEDLNLLQVYNQYRAKHNIPFPDEIVKIREFYGLSSLKMSKILGFGEHQLNRYENLGEVPSESNGKILAAIKNTDVFEIYLQNAANQLSDKELANIHKKLKAAKDAQNFSMQESLVYKNIQRGKFNGFGELNFKKFEAATAYILSKTGKISNSKLNSLLFFADLFSYVKNAEAITGLSYKKNCGNIRPENFEIIYGLSDCLNTEIQNNFITTIALKNSNYDFSALDKKYLDVLDLVINIYGNFSEKQLSEKISEIKNLKDNELINFDIAFFSLSCRSFIFEKLWN